MLYEVITLLASKRYKRYLKTTEAGKIRLDRAAITVITSYSIHYTKLYESPFQALAFGQMDLLQPSIPNTELGFRCAETIGRHGQHRITSYNVCYTKLLRAL